MRVVWRKNLTLDEQLYGEEPGALTALARLCSAKIDVVELRGRRAAPYGGPESGMMNTMLHVARAIVEVLSDLVKLFVLCLRPASAIRAENLVLRKQLAAYIERGVKPRRL